MRKTSGDIKIRVREAARRKIKQIAAQLGGNTTIADVVDFLLKDIKITIQNHGKKRKRS